MTREELLKRLGEVASDLGDQLQNKQWLLGSWEREEYRRFFSYPLRTERLVRARDEISAQKSAVDEAIRLLSEEG